MGFGNAENELKQLIQMVYSFYFAKSTVHNNQSTLEVISMAVVTKPAELTPSLTSRLVVVSPAMDPPQEVRE